MSFTRPFTYFLNKYPHVPTLVVYGPFVAMYTYTLYNGMRDVTKQLADQKLKYGKLPTSYLSAVLVTGFTVYNVGAMINTICLPLKVFQVSHETWNRPPIEDKPMKTKVLDFIKEVYN